MNKLTERLVIGASALVIGLLIGWAVRGLLSYSSATETMTSYQDWRTACPPASFKDQKCQVIEDVLDSKSQSPVVRVSISSNSAGKAALQLVLPLGVFLEPGAGLILGNDPVRLMQYRTCTSLGCVAIMPLDDKALTSFSSSKDARVLIAGLDGKPVAIPLSLKGYGEAMHAYKSAEARRSSWFWRLFS